MPRDMGVFQTGLDHLKNHVEYPATREEAIAACNGATDMPKADSEWFAKSLPKGTYKTPTDILNALLKQV